MTHLEAISQMPPHERFNIAARFLLLVVPGVVVPRKGRFSPRFALVPQTRLWKHTLRLHNHLRLRHRVIF